MSEEVKPKIFCPKCKGIDLARIEKNPYTFANLMYDEDTGEHSYEGGSEIDYDGQVATHDPPKFWCSNCCEEFLPEGSTPLKRFALVYQDRNDQVQVYLYEAVEQIKDFGLLMKEFDINNFDEERENLFLAGEVETRALPVLGEVKRIDIPEAA